MTSDKPCRFCAELESLERCYQVSSSWATDDELKKYGKYMIEYGVVIVTRTWYKKMGKRNAARATHYRKSGLGFSMNYCPECGRRL